MLIAVFIGGKPYQRTKTIRCWKNQSTQQLHVKHETWLTKAGVFFTFSPGILYFRPGLELNNKGHQGIHHDRLHFVPKYGRSELRGPRVISR